MRIYGQVNSLAAWQSGLVMLRFLVHEKEGMYYYEKDGFNADKYGFDTFKFGVGVAAKPDACTGGG